jgi:hypothetical protein
MRGEIITFRLVFVTETCSYCGMPFAMTSDYQERRIQDRRTFYCPDGHPQAYTGQNHEEKIKRLQREVELERRSRENAEMAREMEQQQRKAAERELKQIKKRAAAGLCPCCNRSFVQLQRHMATKHPEYAESKSTTPS